MAEEEQDPERELRIRAMVKELLGVVANKSLGDAQTALGNMVGLMCLTVAPQDPDRAFMETVAAVQEVYLAIRAHVRAGKSPDVIPGRLN